MTTSGTSSSSQVQPLAIRRSNHLITISHPHHPYYLVCILHFRDSLFVWLGEAPMGAVGEAQRSNSERLPDGEVSKEEEELLARAKASLSEEDQRQLEVDRQMEEELSKALAAAGRDGGGGARGALEEDEIARQSKGFLAKEWAVAMYKEGLPPISTSLYRTPSDLALPISRRLSKRLGIPQLHLTLSLPGDLLPEGNMPAPPGANQAIMAIEKGLEEAIREALADPRPASV
ncbi:hypothetical protein BCV69DRAFT_282239 [Microstroma glucosiphilum]|uniref:Uncharacterized protein n=1 Tax=Pseudomicrostroma glucosiphilum TaxID=1684307 RepID=A0A316U8F3_9BASI|nr:hypothetical protein BCV69DRAFT_282239 [Pseudomicrostroma glucosiphilum]PWN21517.1 hypothetical protein BCV69DRAFT_282239 [Pseudomicrostroma glucosiphilum]